MARKHIHGGQQTASLVPYVEGVSYGGCRGMAVRQDTACSSMSALWKCRGIQVVAAMVVASG